MNKRDFWIVMLHELNASQLVDVAATRNVNKLEDRNLVQSKPCVVDFENSLVMVLISKMNLAIVAIRCSFRIHLTIISFEVTHLAQSSLVF